jgi:hypothetical protein
MLGTAALGVSNDDHWKEIPSQRSWGWIVCLYRPCFAPR